MHTSEAYCMVKLYQNRGPPATSIFLLHIADPDPWMLKRGHTWGYAANVETATQVHLSADAWYMGKAHLSLPPKLALVLFEFQVVAIKSDINCSPNSSFLPLSPGWMLFRKPKLPLSVSRMEPWPS
jgi:hypothetical protein